MNIRPPAVRGRSAFARTMIAFLLFLGAVSVGGFSRAQEREAVVIRNPRFLPASPIPGERIPLGESDDYKPCLARLPDGELLLTAFHQHQRDADKVMEQILFFRSKDGGKTWSPPEKPDLLGREPYFSVLRDGTIFITTHLLANDVRNPDGYVHGYVHRSADAGRTWTTLRIGAEDVPGVPAKTWTHTSRNVLELQDGTLIMGVSAGSSQDFLWRSNDKGKTWDRSLACQVSGFDVGRQGFPWHAETVFWQARNGDILAIARCFPGALPRLPKTDIPKGDDNVERMALFRSRDGGRHWQLEPELGNDYGEHYPALLRLKDNRLLLTFTVRSLRPPLGVQAVLGVEKAGGFAFDFQSDRLVLDQKTPIDKPSGGGFGPSVQLDDGTLVTSYSYRGEDDKSHLEVVRWKLPPIKPASNSDFSQPPKSTMDEELEAFLDSSFSMSLEPQDGPTLPSPVCPF